MGNFIGSTISESKQNEIKKDYATIIEELKLHRKKHKESVMKLEKDLNSPAWVRVNPAPPMDNNNHCYRLCLGFKNIGCAYREKDENGLGCFNCGYYASTAFKNVDDNIILEQFRKAIKVGYKTNIDFNSIEFLNDGSFFNKDEIGEKLREMLFRIISTMPNIKRVLVESRPEYINEDNVHCLLEVLRDDQMLEVGIGLESADNFVREICINKGYKKKDFEDAIAILSSSGEKKQNNISIVTYLLVKPAFLNEKESINDIISSIKYLKSLCDKYKVQITPKLEPAAIVNGTILSMLYEDKKRQYSYKPLNYWSILEIFARLAIDTNISSFLDVIRVGAREDMDDIIMAPAIYAEDERAYYPFDFVIYESIQKYNQHHDIYRLFTIISEVYKKSNGIEIIEDPSLKFWKKKNGVNDCAIETILNDEIMITERNKRKEKYEYEINFMIKIYTILDIMEGYNNEHDGLKNDIDESIYNMQKQKLEESISKCFQKIYPQIFVEIVVNTLSVNDNEADVFFDVKDLFKDTAISIWSKFTL